MPINMIKIFPALMSILFSPLFLIYIYNFTKFAFFFQYFCMDSMFSVSNSMVFFIILSLSLTFSA